jgi:hypothetical protein
MGITINPNDYAQKAYLLREQAKTDRDLIDTEMLKRQMGLNSD